METKSVDYQIGKKIFKGFLANDESKKGKKPGVLVVPAWMGLDDFAKEKAKELAKMGFIALAADLYGEGKQAKNTDEAGSLMSPLFLDRALLKERVVGSFETLKKQEGVDQNKMGAIGFCFGGLSAIELFRSGVDVKGVVSFHGLLGPNLGDMKSKTVQIAKGIKGSILILHGHDDPLVSQDDIVNTQKEFTDAKVDWQMHIYGNTKHAFTNPEAHDESMGLVYNEKAKKRAWKSMTDFFEEVFK